jgi:succinate dehydrogenase / fumarate reductase iron-sulfur subunit
VLELLHRVKWEQDGTLAFRRSCSHGICGSDGMRINGANRLPVNAGQFLRRRGSCQIQLSRCWASSHQRLIVDMEPFFEHYRQILPYLINDSALPSDGRERLQVPLSVNRFDDPTNVFFARAAQPVAPAFGRAANMRPGGYVQAHRFISTAATKVLIVV